MKQIFLVVLLSTILFSAPRQIILGSYTEEKNAIEGVQKLQEHIEDSDKLSWLKKTNVIEANYKKVGKYFVVYLLPKGNKNQVFRAYNALERYYEDAYVIEYAPEVGAMQKIKVTDRVEVIEDITVTKKSQEKIEIIVDEEEEIVTLDIPNETVIKDDPSNDEYASDEDMLKISAELKKLEEEVNFPKEKVIVVKDTIKETKKVAKVTPKKEPVKITKIQEEVSQNNYFLEILLVILVLIGVVYIIYKNRHKKEEKELQEII